MTLDQQLQQVECLWRQGDARTVTQQEALRKQQEEAEKAKAEEKRGVNRKRDPGERDAGEQVAGAEAGKREADASPAAEKANGAPAEEPVDEELLARVREIEEALRKAWSLARCDTRLTRRLGLL